MITRCTHRFQTRRECKPGESVSVTCVFSSAPFLVAWLANLRLVTVGDPTKSPVFSLDHIRLLWGRLESLPFTSVLVKALIRRTFSTLEVCTQGPLQVRSELGVHVCVCTREASRSVWVEVGKRE
jgi:hypothetical protein